jgi:hypothetical protein
MRARTALAGLVLATIALAHRPADLRADDTPARILGPGDLVAGFGRIGTSGLVTLGMDARGRVLLAREGTVDQSLFWADGAQFSAVVDPPELGTAVASSWEAGWSPAGNVAILVDENTALATGHPSAVYVSIGGDTRRVATAGERDADGATFCFFRQPRVNDAGTVAFAAAVAPIGAVCNDWDAHQQAVYVEREGLQRVIGTGSLAPPGTALDLLALTPDGSAIVTGSAQGQPAVLTVGADAIDVLLGPGSIGVSGAPLDWFSVVAANHAGDVLFTASEGSRLSVYRTDHGRIVRVFGEGDTAPWGDAYRSYDLDSNPDWAVLNDRGDLLWHERYQAVLHPADGGPARLFPGLAVGGQIDAAGDVAVTRLIAGNGALDVVRWRDGQATRIAGTGDVLPGGDVLAARGLDRRCLGGDGSIAVGADAVDGTQGLLCGDAAGFHAVARVGDPAPGGRRFYAFGQCQFGRPGELVFSADRLVPNHEWDSVGYAEYWVDPAVYRARADRLERVIGSGDVTADGSVVSMVSSLDDGPRRVSFDTNGAGDVLALVGFGDWPGAVGAGLVVRSADGPLVRLPIVLDNGAGMGGVGFGNLSPVDHLYLSGESQVPTRPGDGSAGGSVRRDRASAAPMSLDLVGTDRRFDVVGARLMDSGAVAVLAVEAIRDWAGNTDGRVVVLLWKDGALEQIFASTDRSLRRPVASGLQVAGERLAFDAGATYDDFSGQIFSYTIGDAQPQPVVHDGDPSPIGPLGAPSLLGLTGDGRIYISAWQNGRMAILYWQDGALHSVAALDDAWPVAVGDSGTVLLDDAETTLRVVDGRTPSAASCPAPPTLIAPTATITPTPEPTRTPQPTRTRTAPPPTRTATATSTAIPTCGPHTACLGAGSATAPPGGHARVDVTLSAAGAVMAGVQNDLEFPPGVQVDGCTVNPAIDKPASAFRVVSPDVRAVIVALDNLDAIPDGAVLYTCDVEVAADAAPGRLPIRCTNAHAATARGEAVPIGCADGALVVQADPTPTVRAAATVTSAAPGAHGDRALSGAAGGGCAIAQSPTADHAWLLLLGAPLLAVTRHLGRGGRLR